MGAMARGMVDVPATINEPDGAIDAGMPPTVMTDPGFSVCPLRTKPEAALPVYVCPATVMTWGASVGAGAGEGPGF